MRTSQQFKNIGKILSKAEMRNIQGGNVPRSSANTSCECVGSTGAWTYKGHPPVHVIGMDVMDYCRSGQAHCTRS